MCRSMQTPADLGILRAGGTPYFCHLGFGFPVFQAVGAAPFAMFEGCACEMTAFPSSACPKRRIFVLFTVYEGNIQSIVTGPRSPEAYIAKLLQAQSSEPGTAGDLGGGELESPAACFAHPANTAQGCGTHSVHNSDRSSEVLHPPG